MQVIKQMSILMMINRGGHAELMGEHGFPQEEDLWELITVYQIYGGKAERGKTWGRTSLCHLGTTVSLQTNVTASSSMHAPRWPFYVLRTDMWAKPEACMSLWKLNRIKLVTGKTQICSRRERMPTISA